MIQLVLSKYVDFTVVQPEVSLNQLNWKSEVEMFGCGWKWSHQASQVVVRKWIVLENLGLWEKIANFDPGFEKHPGNYRL